MENSETSRATAASQPTTASENTLVPAGRVNGTTVYSRSGEKIAKVEDVAIEKVGGKVAYAILSFGGFLGMGENYRPVPWNMLHYDARQGGFVIDCDKGQLEQAPSFRPDDLSGWTDFETRDAIYEHYRPYGAVPYWA
jgi:sporulation protein YlmC with PRC-barrel domain